MFSLIALTSMSSGTCTSQPWSSLPLAKASACLALSIERSPAVGFLLFISTPVALLFFLALSGEPHLACTRKYAGFYTTVCTLNYNSPVPESSALSRPAKRAHKGRDRPYEAALIHRLGQRNRENRIRLALSLHPPRRRRRRRHALLQLLDQVGQAGEFVE